MPITLELLPERYLEGREFLLLKKSFDVFTNPNTERLLDRLDPTRSSSSASRPDVCDDAAIRGFLARGLKVRFVEDAARGLDDERVAICTASWREKGSNSPPLRELPAPSSPVDAGPSVQMMSKGCRGWIYTATWSCSGTSWSIGGHCWA